MHYSVDLYANSKHDDHRLHLFRIPHADDTVNDVPAVAAPRKCTIVFLIMEIKDLSAVDLQHFKHRLVFYGKIKFVRLHRSRTAAAQTFLDQSSLIGLEQLPLLHRKIQVARFYTITCIWEIIFPVNEAGKCQHYHDNNR